jgi:hypothetical protein
MKRRLLILAIYLGMVFTLFIGTPPSPVHAATSSTSSGCTTLLGYPSPFHTAGFSGTYTFNQGDVLTLTASLSFSLTVDGITRINNSTSGSYTFPATGNYNIAVSTPGFAYNVDLFITCVAGVYSPPGVNPLTLAFQDGRCNQQADQTVVVYPDNKGGYEFYTVKQGVGNFAFSISKKQLDDNPAKDANYLIAHNLNVWLYRMTDGSLLVTGIKPDGTQYSYNLRSCGAV